MSVQIEENTSARPADRLHPEPRHEPLVFERSGEGKIGYSLPPLDVPETLAIPPRWTRPEIAGETEVTEVEVARHFTRLSRLNFSIDQALYPLGSCTMKHNPRVNEEAARLPGFAAVHPLAPEEVCQGALELGWLLEKALAELTGLARVTLQPAAGAHGELAAILMVRAALEKKGNPRSIVLIPDSAHGTNPASAHFAGYKVQELKSNARGTLDLPVLEEAMTGDVAALMLTVPNTLGIFENQILEIARIVHAKGGYLYCDGANFNSFVGVAKPGLMGIDVMHMNLHKTFSTPHGGGGPGAGPVAVTKELVPFLPRPTIERREDGSFSLDYDRPESIGRLRTFLGNFGMLVRALAYIAQYGNRIGEVARGAVLNANYVRAGLAGVYHLKYDAPSMHEVVFSDKKQSEFGVHAGDIGKRLMDFGFHPPTISFPLIVHGALMIEPTETEGKASLDSFVAAMRRIAREIEDDPQIVLTAPHTTPVRRVDEVGAARNLVLRWRPDSSRKTEDGRRRKAFSPPSTVSRLTSYDRDPGYPYRTSMSSAFHRRCPFCSGDMLRSRTNQYGYAHYFWQKPWKRSFLGLGAERVYPWACMGCGVVLFYLDRLPAVAEEFRSLRDEKRVPEGQPAALEP